MAARIITVEGYETQWLERYQDEFSDMSSRRRHG